MCEHQSFILKRKNRVGALRHAVEWLHLLMSFGRAIGDLGNTRQPWFVNRNADKFEITIVNVKYILNGGSIL